MWIFGIRTAVSGSDGKRYLNNSLSSLLTDSVSVCVGAGVASLQPGSKDQNKRQLTQMYTENCSRLRYEKVMRHLFLCWFVSTQWNANSQTEKHRWPQHMWNVQLLWHTLSLLINIPTLRNRRKHTEGEKEGEIKISQWYLND